MLHPFAPAVRSPCRHCVLLHARGRRSACAANQAHSDHVPFAEERKGFGSTRCRLRLLTEEKGVMSLKRIVCQDWTRTAKPVRAVSGTGQGELTLLNGMPDECDSGCVDLPGWHAHPMLNVCSPYVSVPDETHRVWTRCSLPGLALRRRGRVTINREQDAALHR